MEFRYEDDGDRYLLYLYDSHEGSPRQQFAGSVATRPGWLDRILGVAKVAGVIVVKHPPPQRLLWFVTDDDYNLVRFTKL